MNNFEQLALDLCLNDETQFTNFFIGNNNNKKLFEILKNFKHTSSFQFIYLWGKKGCGKTHLLSACCQQWGKATKVVYLPLTTDLSPTILDNLEFMDLSCLDNLEKVIGNTLWEEALFHWFNKTNANNGKILIAACASPHQLNFVLPDLQSRMLNGAVFQVHELDDLQKPAALQLRANSLGLDLSTKAGLFLINHCQRDMHNLFTTLRKLDKAALVAKRKITIPFIKKILMI